LRRLLKPDKGRPFLRACQRLPVEVAPQVGMSVRGAAVFLRVGYVAGHCMAYIRLQTRSGDVSVGSKAEKLNGSICFPLCPQQRTCSDCVGMSVSCQEETHALQHLAFLFDRIIGGLLG
jgi:hypothetical protein